MPYPIILDFPGKSGAMEFMQERGYHIGEDSPKVIFFTLKLLLVKFTQIFLRKKIDIGFLEVTTIIIIYLSIYSFIQPKLIEF